MTLALSRTHPVRKIVHGPLCDQPLWAPLVPCGLGPCGPSWALVGQALVGPTGPFWAGPCWPPWALVGRTLVGPPGPIWAGL